ncbi:unnamed protein product, partial [Polarella glacialis]
VERVGRVTLLCLSNGCGPGACGEAADASVSLVPAAAAVPRQGSSSGIEALADALEAVLLTPGQAQLPLAPRKLAQLLREAPGTPATGAAEKACAIVTVSPQGATGKGGVLASLNFARRLHEASGATKASPQESGNE